MTRLKKSAVTGTALQEASSSCGDHAHHHGVPDGDFSVDSILERLRNEGLRITPGRRKILEVLFEADHPVSLEEIREKAGHGKSGPDYATVFRMISLLENLQLVQKVNLQRACSFYELHDPSRHYDHVICTICGKVVLITEPCPLGSLEEAIARKYGFRDLTHSLEFFGRCENC
jgi:Fe2+ or Zn2+ uptake regulation protein